MKAKATHILTAGMHKAGSWGAYQQAQFEADPATIAQRAIAAPYKRQEQAANANAKAYREYIKDRNAKQQLKSIGLPKPAMTDTIMNDAKRQALEGIKFPNSTKPKSMLWNQSMESLK